MIRRKIQYAFLSAGCCLAASANEMKQPNILLILADDAGWSDFGFQHKDPAYQKATPNIDRIAEQGVRFAHAYVSGNVCAPSRAGLMTGLYQQRVGFQDNYPQYWGDTPDRVWLTDEWKAFGLDESAGTVADYLNPLGYFCGIVGKWHLGYADRYLPTRRGFDFYCGLRAGSRSFFRMDRSEWWVSRTNLPPYYYHQLENNNGLIPEKQVGHVTEFLGDAALGFLEQAEADGKPFFLYLSFTAPHNPLEPDEKSLSKAKQLFPDASEKRQKYMGLIIGMDEQVGRVLDRLAQKGLDENTLVVFLSDNGGSSINASNNDPLRGYKWSPFEGGYRVPMAIRWPGIVRPGSAVEMPVSSLDLLPTFVAAAGGRVPPNLDGRAMQPLLHGEPIEPRWLFWRDENAEGLTSTVMRYPWKLVLRQSSEWVKLADPEPWLFNLERDPSETDNLAGQYPETVRELTGALTDWQATLPEPRW